MFPRSHSFLMAEPGQNDSSAQALPSSTTHSGTKQAVETSVGPGTQSSMSIRHF